MTGRGRGIHHLGWPLAALLVMAACGHTEPFTAGRYGAEGPLGAGPWPWLTIDTAANPNLTDDERGILYLVGRRPVISPPDPAGLTGPLPLFIEVGQCLSLLPASGGSAIWQLCDPFLERTGRVAQYPVAAIGAEGQVAYMEVRKQIGLSVPVRSQVDLMVTDTAIGSKPRRVMMLYRDSIGRSLTPPTEANWFTAFVWADRSRLVAHAAYRDPNPEGSPRWLDLRVGTVGADTVEWQILPFAGPPGALAMAESGRAVVVWRSDGSLTRVPLDGGSVADATLDAVTDGAVLADLRCRGDRCLAIVRAAGGSEFTAWQLTLPAFSAQRLGDFLWFAGAPIWTGTNGRAIGRLERRLVLIDGVVPALP